MRSRRVMVLALLAGLLVPLHAQARTAAPTSSPARDVQVVTGRVRPLVDYVRRGFTPAQAVRVRLLDSLAASGVPRHAVQQHAVAVPGALCDLVQLGFVEMFSFTYYPDLQPAGDLDGDGRPDVIESVELPTTKTTSRWVVHARDARTGRILWSHRAVHDQYHYGLAIPMTVGRRPAAGVLLIDLGVKVSGVIGQHVEISLVAQAVNGRGHALWRQASSGDFDFSVDGSTYRHAPLGLQIAKLRRGAEDLLITTYDGGGRGKAVTGSLLRVSGGTGKPDRPVPAVSSVGTSLTGAVADSVLGATNSPLPYLGVLPDQNGNGRTDLFTARVGNDHVMTVYDGDRGTTIWSSALLPLYGYLDVTDAGVLSQAESRVHDLALASGLPGGLELGAGLGLGFELSGTVVLVGAGTGDLVWVRPGQQAYPLGQVGGRPVLGTATSTTRHSTGAYVVDEELDVYDALGAVVSRRHYTFSVPTNGCPIGASFLVMDLGDLDGDRAQEGQIYFVVFMDDGSKPPVRDYETVVRGRDGAELDHARAYSLGGAVDGHGVDRATWSQTAHSVSVHVVHGDTLRPMWSASLAVTNKAFALDTYAMSPRPDGCSEVALLGYGDGSRSTALLASNGRAWWRVVYGSKQFEGTLTHDRAARSLC